MSVYQQSRSAVARFNVNPAPEIALAMLFLAAIIPTIAFLLFVKTPLILPSLSLISLLIAGLVAAAAWMMRARRERQGITLWDVSGAYAFVGFAAGMLSEPMQVVELMSLPMSRTGGCSITSASDAITPPTRLSGRPGCFAMLTLMSQEASALFQVVLIDLVLAGDNAIVIGLAAAGLPLEQRAKAVLIGIVAATLLRISFALATTQLLQVVGLVLAGGILLLWVSWKMFRELRTSSKEKEGALEVVSDVDINSDGTIANKARAKIVCTSRHPNRDR